MHREYVKWGRLPHRTPATNSLASPSCEAQFPTPQTASRTKSKNCGMKSMCRQDFDSAVMFDSDSRGAELKRFGQQGILQALVQSRPCCAVLSDRQLDQNSGSRRAQ